MKTLIFDVQGDFGHFKKFYTTSSPLTFPFPPPPTVKGMVGAITGKDKTEYLNIFSSEYCKIAIRILSPVKKVRMGLNHINTKENIWIPLKKGKHQAYTQIRTEFVKNPCYRLYITHSDETIFKELVDMVKAHKMVYTLSLGLSELLADFQYVGVQTFIKKMEGKCEIDSVLPMSAIKEQGLIFKAGRKYLKEKIPIDMTDQRIVQRYEDILFEEQGKTICTIVDHYWQGENGDKIVFF